MYGQKWPEGSNPLAIEFGFIRGNGYFTVKNKTYGEGLFHHFKAAMSLLWPEDDHHRWSDTIIREYVTNRITVVMGSRDSSKTRTLSKCALIDYFVFPDETLILMTSTNIRGLELRVWGDIKNLHERAKAHYPALPGNVSDSKHGIFTDRIDSDGAVRDMRRGILCVPCIGSRGEYMGDALKDFCGIKQKRRRLIGDEMQFIPREYLKVLDSLDKGDFRAGFLGNPIAENGKALDDVSAPVNGWDSIGEIQKTTVWKNRYNGVTINLVGIDSPNFDKETLHKFSYLLDQDDIDRVSQRPGGKDSIEWWSQIMGVRKAGAVMNRVLTPSQIENYGGFKDVIWQGDPLTKVYAIDAGFGGDPCIRTWLEFGTDVTGQQVIRFGDQVEIPILVSSELTPEKQIARYAKEDCNVLGIPASNVFFDAGMYATLAVEMAREMSPEVNAVNCGGTATERPVDNSTFVFDSETQMKRLKTWYEHVSKFITELYFVVRLLCQCRQARMFPRPAAEEMGRRMWDYVSGNRYELETKEDYKLRNAGDSPNYADSLVIAVEGARRLGFSIELMPDEQGSATKDSSYLEKELQMYRRRTKKRALSYA